VDKFENWFRTGKKFFKNTREYTGFLIEK